MFLKLYLNGRHFYLTNVLVRSCYERQQVKYATEYIIYISFVYDIMIYRLKYVSTKDLTHSSKPIYQLTNKKLV